MPNRNILRALVCLFWAGLLQGQLKIVENPVPDLIADKSGNASITLTILNSSPSSSTPIPLQFSVSNFTYTLPDDKKTYEVATNATVTAVSGGLPATLAANASVPIRVAVSGLTDIGKSTAQLRNSGSDIAELQALRTASPFNVQTDGSNEVTFAPDSTPSITVKNADPTPYQFKWTLQSNGKSWTGSMPVNVAASGSASIDLSEAKPEDGFWSSGTLKGTVTDGKLLLDPQLPDNAPPQAPVVLPLKIHVRYWGSGGQAFSTFFFTGILLLAGSLASLLFRYFVPNALGAIKFRRQVREMEQKLNGIGKSLPSQYRVLLAAEFAACRRRLLEIPMVFPAFSDRLTEIQTNATMYNQWLEIAYSVSTTLDDAQRILQTGMPPTIMKWIEEKCSEALEPIESGFTKPEELQGMQAALTSAVNYVKALKSGSAITDLEAEIKGRESKVRPQLTPLSEAFPEFAQLLSQVANAPAAISADRYFERDTISTQANLLSAYRDLGVRRGAAVFPPPAQAVGVAVGAAGRGLPPPNALSRMLELDETFRSYVRPESYESLRTADLFLSEMEQDYYPRLLLAEIGKPKPALEILMAPSPVHAFEPIRFSLRFEREDLNGRAAIREFDCKWDFGDKTDPELGWDVYHSFAEAGPRTVTVTLTDLKGNPVATKAPIERPIDVSAGNISAHGRQRRRVSPEAKVEGLQLAFVLVIALAGVYTTARDKVETMAGPAAVLTLIGIGFGADTLKNLLTQKPGQQ